MHTTFRTDHQYFIINQQDSAVCGKFYIQVIQFKYFVFARLTVTFFYGY